MQQDQFDRWLKESARDYNAPPATNLESLWTAIDAQRQTGAPSVATPVTAPVVAVDVVSINTRRPIWNRSWVRAAALLAVGVGLGRVSVGSLPTSSSAPAMSADSTQAVAAMTEATLDAPDAEKYLGQTVALLASLQTDARPARGDTLLASRAARLLSTTRFLLDSPGATDPSVRGLLEDLELVLVQIVQMPSSRSATDVELIHQAMKQRDVMPRLRTAVASLNSAD